MLLTCPLIKVWIWCNCDTFGADYHMLTQFLIFFIINELKESTIGDGKGERLDFTIGRRGNRLFLCWRLRLHKFDPSRTFEFMFLI